MHGFLGVSIPAGYKMALGFYQNFEFNFPLMFSSQVAFTLFHLHHRRMCVDMNTVHVKGAKSSSSYCDHHID